MDVLIPLRKDWIERLFERFTVLYGNKFVDQWKNVDPQMMMDAWAEELAGFTGDEIRRGLDRCRTDYPDWPPNVLQFMKSCRPEVDPETAFYEAVEQMRKRHIDGSDKWTNKVTYWAAESFGAYDLRNSSWQVAKTRWSRVYGEMLAEKNLPDIPTYTPAPKLPPPKIDKEEAKQKMADIKFVFGSKPTRKSVIARWILVIKENHSSCGGRMAHDGLKELRPTLDELLNAGMNEDAANEFKSIFEG